MHASTHLPYLPQGVHLSHLTFHPSPLTSPLTPHPSPSPPPLTHSSPNTNMYFIHKIFFFNCFTNILTGRIYIYYIYKEPTRQEWCPQQNKLVCPKGRERGGRGEGEGREGKERRMEERARDKGRSACGAEPNCVCHTQDYGRDDTSGIPPVWDGARLSLVERERGRWGRRGEGYPTFSYFFFHLLFVSWL